jgi:putative addiction module component (TIGR02574 family)
MSSNFVDTAKRLPLAERIELVEALWESITQEGYEPSLTPEQADELDRRVEAHRRSPNDVVAWEFIEKELMNRRS